MLIMIHLYYRNNLFPFLKLNKIHRKENIHVFSKADLQHGKKFVQFPLYNFYRVPAALQAFLAKSHENNSQN
jgi:hypothetical protein